MFILLSLIFLYLESNPMARSNEEQWQTSFDFDGDKKRDTIEYKFTGGGHCCYQVSIQLTSVKNKIKIPFDIDGSYVVFNLSQPNIFFIKDYDCDGLPDIFMNIYSYNGMDAEIPGKIKKKYGIKTNRIIVGFKNGTIKYSDLFITR